jgi:hypothetical protein
MTPITTVRLRRQYGVMDCQIRRDQALKVLVRDGGVGVAIPRQKHTITPLCTTLLFWKCNTPKRRFITPPQVKILGRHVLQQQRTILEAAIGLHWVCFVC